jgi:hypothetical protein
VALEDDNHTMVGSGFTVYRLGSAVSLRLDCRSFRKTGRRWTALWGRVWDGLGNADCSPSHHHSDMLNTIPPGFNAIPSASGSLSVVRSALNGLRWSWPGSRGVFILFVSLVFSDVGAAYGQSAQESAENLAKMHEAWGTKASTPGTSLTIKESSRSGQVIKLRLTATGLPKEGAYSLVTWPVTQREPSKLLSGVTLDGSGLAICAGTPGTCSGNQPDDPIDVNVRPVPGEPVRLGLVSEDGTKKVLAKTVPVPLQGEDRGCTIEATLLSPGAEVVLVEGVGFLSDSEITMDSQSGNEHIAGKGKADSGGRYKSIILPVKKGILNGTTRLKLTGSGCAPSIDIQWRARN